MCRSIILAYTCNHDVVVRLSTCRGTITTKPHEPAPPAFFSSTSGDRHLKPPRAACTAAPSMVFPQRSACGPCELRTHEDKLAQDRDLAEVRWTLAQVTVHYDTVDDQEDAERLSAAREVVERARNKYDSRSWNLSKQFARPKNRVYFRPKHRVFVGAGTNPTKFGTTHGSVKCGSPLKHELLADEIEDVDSDSDDDGWGSGYAEFENDYSQLDDEAEDHGDYDDDHWEVSSEDETADYDNSSDTVESIDDYFGHEEHVTGDEVANTTSMPSDRDDALGWSWPHEHNVDEENVTLVNCDADGEGTVEENVQLDAVPKNQGTLDGDRRARWKCCARSPAVLL